MPVVRINQVTAKLVWPDGMNPIPVSSGLIVCYNAYDGKVDRFWSEQDYMWVDILYWIDVAL